MEKYESMIRIHYDGDIAQNHQIPMRILGKCLTHIQSAIDRAYLDIKHDGVWKYARMAPDDYIKTEYIIQSPKEGGYILDFFSSIKESKKIANRISSAIDQALEQVKTQTTSIKDQVLLRKNQILQEIKKPISFSLLFDHPSPEIVRQYGDRSIAKEIDQVLTTIRSDYSGDSTFELSLTGDGTKKYDFNKQKSISFHDAVSKRSVGIPVQYAGQIDEPSMKKRRCKFTNNENGKTSILHLNSDEDFLLIHPYAVPDKEIKFIGCPLIEFGALEPNCGDIFFIELDN